MTTTRRQHHRHESHGSLLLADTPRNDAGDAQKKRKPSRNAGCSVKILFLVLVLTVISQLPHAWMPLDGPQNAERDLTVLEAPPLFISSSASDTLQLQECSIPHHAVSVQEAVGSLQPVVLSGWNTTSWMTTPEAFIKDHGTTPFYVKDSAVQIRSAQCVLSFQSLWKHITMTEAAQEAPMAFTNDQENKAWFARLPAYYIPPVLKHITGFSVFSVLRKGQSHSFHKHGESWIASAAGYKVWWFLPPTQETPEKVNACLYLTGKAKPPPGTTSCVQSPGTIIWFPKDWYHATCALTEWTAGIGKQQGPLIRQRFPALPENVIDETDATVNEIMEQCMTKSTAPDGDWKWYDGNLTLYYNDLEKDHNRNPNDMSKYAVHRWMGEKRSTLIHYELIHGSLTRYGKARQTVLDAGCGLGSALMWMEQREPTWTLQGRTISDEQLQFIEQKLPQHKFQVQLQSYDELNDDETPFDAIYSIEAMIHSTDIAKTLSVWARHLAADGTIVIIDDFLSPGVNRDEPDVEFFSKSWLANSLVTTVELSAIARRSGLELVESRDLLAEYRIVELNYRNSIPKMDPDANKNHQGWMGSKLRQKLTVEGKLGYNMVVFKKKDWTAAASDENCPSVPSSPATSVSTFPNIIAKDECLSGWYCCNQSANYLEQLAANRTHRYGYLKLDESLFGNYMEIFAAQLNSFYKQLPGDYTGRFLDIGATGSTASGMTQVTTKFQHFAGPLEYWMLDSDPAAKALNQTIYCDVCDCPDASTCGFDVTFSHTVLEHASHPHKAFDTVARVTKKGGLTMHLLPFSYQYHATPDDYYRFSHSALKVLVSCR